MKLIKDYLQDGLISDGHTFGVIKNPKDKIKDFNREVGYCFSVGHLKDAIKTMESLLKTLKQLKPSETNILLWIFNSEKNQGNPCILIDANNDDFGVILTPIEKSHYIKSF